MIEKLCGTNNDREKDDFYATPKIEVENILKHENLGGTILENSCGNGNISSVVKKYYDNVISTDLVDRGYGESGLDFLDDGYKYTTDIDCVIMNPPFKLITEFIIKSLKMAKSKVVVLGRIQLLETQGRYEKIFKDNPPSRVYVYVDRISCLKGDNAKLKQPNAMSYAWYVWDKGDSSSNTLIKWIRRGNK